MTTKIYELVSVDEGTHNLTGVHITLNGTQYGIAMNTDLPVGSKVEVVVKIPNETTPCECGKPSFCKGMCKNCYQKNRYKATHPKKKPSKKKSKGGKKRKSR